MQTRRPVFGALVAAVAIAAATPSVARAAASEPCWHRVIMDWTKDGLITPNRYSPHCLRTAMKKTPEDLRDYSSIIDDINAALADAVGVANGGMNGNGPGGTMGPSSGPGGGGGVDAPGSASPKVGEKAKKAVADAGTPASAPGRDRSIPLPLILLGCVLLLAALAAGSPPLVKRFRTRFPRLKPAPGSVRPPA